MIEENDGRSPDNATLRVEQDLFDAGDPAKLIATVHKTDNGSVGNVWYEQTERAAFRLLPEKQFDGEPDAFALMGEAMRLADSQISKSDRRISVGSLGLHAAATALYDRTQKNQ